MTHATSGQIGWQMPWKQVRGTTMRVDSFDYLGADIVDGKIRTSVPRIPLGMATVEILITDAAMRHRLTADTGTDSLWLSLPVQHEQDFRVFHWVFKVRHVAEDEEVLAIYLPSGGLMSRFRPRLAITIEQRGNLRRTFDAVQRGEPEPESESIWMHAPNQRFEVP